MIQDDTGKVVPHEEKAVDGGPITAVSAAIFRGGKVLLVKRARAPAHGLWTLPGGRQNVGETLESAVIREVAEETGLKIAEPLVCDALDVFTPDGQHFVVVAFACRCEEGEIMPSEELSSHGWFALEDTESLAVTPGLSRVLHNAARRLGETCR